MVGCPSLQGKRGLEKPPFKLPDFIEATGISKMREAYVEKEAAKQMKQKQRERMAPKMGRMDIDYQVGVMGTGPQYLHSTLPPSPQTRGKAMSLIHGTGAA